MSPSPNWANRTTRFPKPTTQSHYSNAVENFWRRSWPIKSCMTSTPFPFSPPLNLGHATITVPQTLPSLLFTQQNTVSTPDTPSQPSYLTYRGSLIMLIATELSTSLTSSVSPSKLSTGLNPSSLIAPSHSISMDGLVNSLKPSTAPLRGPPSLPYCLLCILSPSYAWPSIGRDVHCHCM